MGADDAPDRLTEGGENTAPQQDPSGQDPGWWLTEQDGAKVKHAVLELWKRQNATASKREAQSQRNELTRRGIRGVKVVESQERDEYTIRAPFGADEQPKAPNKADQLIRRVASTLTVDPPGPDVSPTSDDDDEREQAQMAERILKVEGAPAERDDVSMLRQAIDQAGTYASMFSHTWLNPQHCLKPVEIQAHPQAQTADDALFITQPQIGPDGLPVLDEMGQPVTAQIPADPASLVTRYVRIDGTLTDRRADAMLGWEPRVMETLLRPSQVRFVPPVNVTGIEDAPGVLIGEVQPLSMVVARYYGGERPDPAVIAQLVGFKPDGVDWKKWVPKAQQELLSADPPKRPDGQYDDTALVATLTLYLVSGPMAPLGARVVIGGPQEPIVREEWRVTVGEADDAHVEYLPLPVAQLRWKEDTATGDPMGIAGVDDLGPMEDMRAAALRHILDYIDRFGTRQTYLPFGSTMQPDQVAFGFKKPPIMLESGQRPWFEDLPGLAPEIAAMYEAMGKEENTAVGLEESAQGLSSPEVKSGRHAQQVIEQALVALAGLQQNANKFITRLWSLRLTFMRAHYSAPRVLDYLGEGGDYQQQRWTGTDLMGAGDVQIARGTNTMMPKSAKVMLAREELQMALSMQDQMGAMRYRRAIEGGTAPLLGMQDDPVHNRIMRQLSQWRNEARQQHEPAPPPVPQQVQDPMTGAVMTQMVPAPDPVAEQAARIFAPNPTDELPFVAPVRLAELVDTLSSRAFLQADPRYQQAIVAEYERMKAASGVMTAAEQQQAQMQQQQMQQALALEQIDNANANQAAKLATAERGGVASKRLAMQTATEQLLRGNPNPEMAA